MVDPARIADYERYRGATIVVPNRVEAELAWGSAIKSPADGLCAGKWLCDRYGFTTAMVKLGADGIAVVGPGVRQHVPTRQRQVCDVTGAGDMVLAVAGLCQAAGWGLVETAELANVPAGLEAEKMGVATVAWDGI